MKILYKFFGSCCKNIPTFDASKECKKCKAKAEMIAILDTEALYYCRFCGTLMHDNGDSTKIVVKVFR